MTDPGEEWPCCVCCGKASDTVLSQDPSGEWWCLDCPGKCAFDVGQSIPGYIDKVNVPLTMETLIALKRQLDSGDVARFKRQGKRND